MASNRNQCDSLHISRFEPYCGSSGNIEALSIRLNSIERKCAVSFYEMVVRANLDWSVAIIGNAELYSVSTLVQGDVFFLAYDGTRGTLWCVLGFGCDREEVLRRDGKE